MNNNQKSAILTGTKMMLAGSMAFFIYLFLPWPYGFWTVVTVAAVTRPGLTNTLGKITTRIIGTLIGCVLAYFILQVNKDNSVIMILLFFPVVVLSSYIALQKTLFNYAGIIIGLTITIILSTSLMSGNLVQTMLYRIIDVLIGIACIAIVNIAIRVVFPKKETVIQNLGAQFRQAFQNLIQWKENKTLIKTSFVVALAASLTFFPWIYWRYPGGYWATISCFLIMEESLKDVQRKSWLRFFSHVITALIGGASAILIGEHTIWLLIPLAISFFIFGYMMVSSKSLSSTGNSMGIALSVMLLASPGVSSSLHIVAARFCNVIGGIAVGLLMIYLMQKFIRNNSCSHN
jgi:uncharacterized membrane protein YccC